MIAPVSSNSSFLVASEVSTPDSLVTKINELFQKKIESISVGIQVGAVELFSEFAFLNLLDLIPGLGSLWADPSLAMEYCESFNFLEDVCLAPILEELFFRVQIQGFFKWICSSVFPDVDIQIFSIDLKLATLVAIVATSILFGAAHLASGLGVLHFIGATLGGITYGVLKEKHGLEASIAAHMTNNGILFLSERFLS